MTCHDFMLTAHLCYNTLLNLYLLILKEVVSKSELLNIVCSNFDQPSEEDVRLVNGDNSFEGRVELSRNGTWGTVCDDLFDINDAQVICRMLGFSGAVAAYSNARYGQGSGQIWLDDVQCNGNEANIWDCQHSGIGSHNCRHSEDASVVCQAGMFL